MRSYLGISYVASIGSIGVASCCVLPMTMMLLGVGGGWIAIFGQVTAYSYYVLGVSTALLIAVWFLSFRRQTIGRLKWWLSGSTIFTGTAWIIVAYEAAINDFLISKM
ncbi:hypothetical protein [Labrenzia sp. PHM005]|uniref:hypothetical protein n=1 Tax=Labrenzia sp. PHM005 TaxID=2590016 RepID=UPI0011403328|nr:hypothetical protein [Labrenzia sp. PHM005]QDG78183.1 hypothetical protein FJ695_21245 [Labrenzia sp. PHM005]